MFFDKTFKTFSNFKIVLIRLFFLNTPFSTSSHIKRFNCIKNILFFPKLAISDTLAIDFDALVIPSGKIHTASLKDELHAIRIIRAFLREGMPVLVQDDALDVICEINDEIDGDALRAGAPLASLENILWASLDANMSEVSRAFVATCLRSTTDSIAEDGSAAA